MIRLNRLLLLLPAFLVLMAFAGCSTEPTKHSAAPTSAFLDPRLVVHVVDPKTSELRFYWQKENGSPYHNFQTLRTELSTSGQQLLFATNGGMFDKTYAPQGLYVENGRELAPLDNTAMFLRPIFLRWTGSNWTVS